MTEDIFDRVLSRGRSSSDDAARMQFAKYERGLRGRWHFAGVFSLAAFLVENYHDEEIRDTLGKALAKLPIGEKIVYDGGAGGIDKFVRLDPGERYCGACGRPLHGGGIPKIDGSRKVFYCSIEHARRGGAP